MTSECERTLVLYGKTDLNVVSIAERLGRSRGAVVRDLRIGRDAHDPRIATGDVRRGRKPDDTSH